jgi:hypothetical protein
MHRRPKHEITRSLLQDVVLNTVRNELVFAGMAIPLGLACRVHKQLRDAAGCNWSANVTAPAETQSIVKGAVAIVQGAYNLAPD